MFYYLLHIFLIHVLAVIAAVATGHVWTDMVVTTWVTNSPGLKGYGFNLPTVYLIWAATVILLYPLCNNWFDKYKRSHQASQWWLSYI